MSEYYLTNTSRNGTKEVRQPTLRRLKHPVTRDRLIPEIRWSLKLRIEDPEETAISGYAKLQKDCESYFFRMSPCSRCKFELPAPYPSLPAVLPLMVEPWAGAIVSHDAEQVDDAQQAANHIHEDLLSQLRELTEKTGLNALADLVRERLEPHFEPRRRNFPSSTRKQVLEWTAKINDGHCPCCGIVRVVVNGQKVPGASFDHALTNQRKDVKNCWLICEQCHVKMTNGGRDHEAMNSFVLFHGRCDSLN